MILPMQAKALLRELMERNSEWEWNSLEGQGFIEIMQAFRNVEKEDKNTFVLAFTVVKDYVRYLFELDEKKRVNAMYKRFSFGNKSYDTGFSAGLREVQIRTKAKKTRIEKKYVELSDKFNIDIQSIILIWGLVNGEKHTKDQISKELWKKNSDYSDWLSLFIRKLSTKDFVLFKDDIDSEKNTSPEKSTKEKSIEDGEKSLSSIAISSDLEVPESSEKKVIKKKKVLH